MDLNKLLENKLMVVVIVLGVLMVGAVVVFPMVIDKVTDSVIEKLQKEYSPGPYFPGIDPDKVNPDFFRNAPPQTHGGAEGEAATTFYEGDASSWTRSWENDRG